MFKKLKEFFSNQEPSNNNENPEADIKKPTQEAIKAVDLINNETQKSTQNTIETVEFRGNKIPLLDIQKIKESEIVEFLGHKIPAKKAKEYYCFIKNSEQRVNKEMISRWIKIGKDGKVWLEADVYELNFTSCNELVSIPEIHGLKKLVLHNSGTKRISYLPDLTELDCSFSNVIDFSNIPNLKNLKCSGVNLSSIENLANLETLDCSHSSVKKIENLPNLKYINCQHTAIKKLANLPNLKEANCMCSSLDTVSNLDKLETLECSHTKLTTLGELPSLKTLKTNSPKLEKYFYL